MDTQSAFTIHPGIVDSKGKTYLFYHNGDLPGGGGFHRSICVDELEFNPDGTIQKVVATQEGAPQNGHLDPYKMAEAETICWTGGVKTECCSEHGMNLCDLNDGDYIKLMGVDFGPTGASKFHARVASNARGGQIELHLDGMDGVLVGTCTVPATGGLQAWEDAACEVKGATGVHDLYLAFTSGTGDLFNIDWWTFDRQ